MLCTSTYDEHQSWHLEKCLRKHFLPLFTQTTRHIMQLATWWCTAWWLYMVVELQTQTLQYKADLHIKVTGSKWLTMNWSAHHYTQFRMIHWLNGWMTEWNEWSWLVNHHNSYLAANSVTTAGKLLWNTMTPLGVIWTQTACIGDCHTYNSLLSIILHCSLSSAHQTQQKAIQYTDLENVAHISVWSFFLNMAIVLAK